MTTTPSWPSVDPPVHRKRPGGGQHHLFGDVGSIPELKIVSVESGTGWIPFILEALDYEMDENAPQAKAALALLPSEYFRRQIYATTWFEPRTWLRSSTPSARTT